MQSHIKLSGLIIIVILLLIIGTTVYSVMEEWSFVDSFYFTGVTLTTIGYGDLVPTHDLSKVFTVFFAFAGVGVVLLAITFVSQHVLEQQHQKTERVILKKIGSSKIVRKIRKK
ncbi:MAG: potassium channel family protein [archaeon]